jgi:hypothetical protein
VDRGAALDLAARIGASFPSSRVGSATLDEWASELQKLDVARGERVLEWLRDNVERAPSFKQIRAGMALASRPKQHPDAWKGESAGLTSPCVLCQQPVTEWADAAAKYDPEFDRWTNAHLSCVDAMAQSHSTSELSGGAGSRRDLTNPLPREPSSSSEVAP